MVQGWSAKATETLMSQKETYIEQHTSLPMSSKTFGFSGMSRYTVPMTKHSCPLITSSTRGTSFGDPVSDVQIHPAYTPHSPRSEFRTHQQHLSSVSAPLFGQSLSICVVVRSRCSRIGVCMFCWLHLSRRLGFCRKEAALLLGGGREVLMEQNY